ncbi:hypothetical protein CH63R_08778 [Colletotrichum higginsianum IMI 349063]|uniref:Uncharacterized protein n=1 Tax=Colletotrichum higginsianum (strain IMI 349063) TaxID=759273 RepID=A0A1B7Y5H4_COLHI|nr:hypothetical protein CH63R_08778 [Colletotrichum higginsianum IMI 349063]OBR07257.1 hypothetical protein CH63R_08778 [Colletotrichum higginsianum IMI 349063]
MFLPTRQRGAKAALYPVILGVSAQPSKALPPAGFLILFIRSITVNARYRQGHVDLEQQLVRKTLRTSVLGAANNATTILHVHLERAGGVEPREDS